MNDIVVDEFNFSLSENNKDWFFDQKLLAHEIFKDDY